MTDRERVEHIRIFLGLNKTAFSKVLGYTTPQSYTSYLNGSNNLSMKMIKALTKHDSRISIDWVLKGQGQMLLNNDISNQQKVINGDSNHAQIGDNNNSSINSNNNSNTKEIEYLKKEIESLNKVIKSQERLISMLEKSLK
jgi:predicted RNase H-like nuclease (RuvC/YqgF family)